MNDNRNITRHMVLHSSNRYSDHNFAIIIAVAAALTKLLNNCIITTSQPLPQILGHIRASPKNQASRDTIINFDRAGTHQQGHSMNHNELLLSAMKPSFNSCHTCMQNHYSEAHWACTLHPAAHLMDVSQGRLTSIFS